jgi:hypothetical protein
MPPPEGLLGSAGNLLGCVLAPAAPLAPPPGVPRALPPLPAVQIALPCYSIGAWPDVCVLIAPLDVPAVLDCGRLAWRVTCRVLPAL